MPDSSPSSAPNFNYFLVLFAGFVILGLDVAITGPTLLEFVVQTNSSVPAVAAVLTGRSVGFLSGTIVGGVLVDKFKNHANITLTTAVSFMALFMFIIPQITSLALLIAINLLHGIALGINDNLSQVLLIREYGSAVHSKMNALHGAFGVGAFFAPIFVAPFLSNAVPADTENTINEEALVQGNGWHKAFYLVGGITVPVVVCMVYFSFIREIKRGNTESLANNSENHNESVRKGERSGTEGPLDEEKLFSLDENHDSAGQIDPELITEEALDDINLNSTVELSPLSPELALGAPISPPESSLSPPTAPKAAEYRLLFLIGIFLFLYVGIETGFGLYIFTYAVKHLALGDRLAAVLNSLFWGSFALGRLLGIGISKVLPPHLMIFYDLTGCVSSLAIMIIFHKFAIALWISTAIYGLSVASIYPSAINYCESRMEISGKLLSFLVIFAAGGESLIPMVLGATFQSSTGPILFLIVIVICAGLATADFSYLYRYANRLKNSVQITPNSPINSAEEEGKKQAKQSSKYAKLGTKEFELEGIEAIEEL
jgi:FHS family Na+ dependent glucose MFS transporter 1